MHVASVLHSVGSSEIHCHKNVFVYSPEYLFSVTPKTMVLKPDKYMSLSFVFKTALAI